MPYIIGMDKFLTNHHDRMGYLKDFGAGTASAGAIGLYHIEGVTPEAIEQGRDLLNEGYQRVGSLFRRESIESRNGMSRKRLPTLSVRRRENASKRWPRVVVVYSWQTDWSINNCEFISEESWTLHSLR